MVAPRDMSTVGGSTLNRQTAGGGSTLGPHTTPSDVTSSKTLGERLRDHKVKWGQKAKQMFSSGKESAETGRGPGDETVADSGVRSVPPPASGTGGGGSSGVRSKPGAGWTEPVISTAPGIAFAAAGGGNETRVVCSTLPDGTERKEVFIPFHAPAMGIALGATTLTYAPLDTREGYNLWQVTCGQKPVSDYEQSLPPVSDREISPPPEYRRRPPSDESIKKNPQMSGGLGTGRRRKPESADSYRQRREPRRDPPPTPLSYANQTYADWLDSTAYREDTEIGRGISDETWMSAKLPIFERARTALRRRYGLLGKNGTVMTNLACELTDFAMSAATRTDTAPVSEMINSRFDDRVKEIFPAYNQAYTRVTEDLMGKPTEFARIELSRGDSAGTDLSAAEGTGENGEDWDIPLVDWIDNAPSQEERSRNFHAYTYTTHKLRAASSTLRNTEDHKLLSTTATRFINGHWDKERWNRMLDDAEYYERANSEKRQRQGEEEAHPEEVEEEREEEEEEEDEEEEEFHQDWLDRIDGVKRLPPR